MQPVGVDLSVLSGAVGLTMVLRATPLSCTDTQWPLHTDEQAAAQKADVSDVCKQTNCL